MTRHRPRKRFGQHFLHDANVLERIVGAIAPKPDDIVAEIGPGEGALTRLLLPRVERLHVVELDRDLAASLAERMGHPDNLEIHAADALKFDFRALASFGGLRVIGNLPYNISTPLLFHLFEQADVIADMHFMLQKEVVDRLVAEPGGGDYGRLSVMAGFHCRMERLFRVGPGAFRPPPKVDSAVIRLVPADPGPGRRLLLPALEDIVRHAFGQRRKTLRNALKGVIDADGFARAGIDPGRRAETLGLDEFLALAAARDND